VSTTGSTPGGADVLLADGSIAVVRPLRPADGPALHELHEQVCDESIRLRFFAVGRRAAHAYVDHVLESEETLALVVEQRGRLLGLATAEPLGADRCEAAFLVADAARGRGVGTLLLEHLAAWAMSRGVATLEADVLAENHAMLSVFADAGLHAQRHSVDGPALVLTLGTGWGPTAWAQADAREFQAEARSLRPLLSPGSVAVAGVRADGSGVGAAVLRSVVAGRFAGPLVVVHPRARSVAGVHAVPTLSELDSPVDLLVVCVPARRVLDVVREAAAAGVRAAVVVSSGFGELGPEGARWQRELVAVARAHDLRLVGPNCLGLLCNQPDVRLNATFHDTMPPQGGLAVASQSGGVGIVLLDLARELELGLHTFVSLGNKADVSGNDLLAAWYDDDDVRVAALYLESFGNAAKFARFARRFARRKPLLAVVGGRSAGGVRAGASHTAAAASPSAGVDALFDQAGVIGCRDAEDLARTALLLTEQPLPRGRRLAIVSNAGGLGVLAADAAGEEGLEVPEFSPGLRERLVPMAHGTSGTGNPVDTGAGASAESLAAAVDVVLGSGEVDSVLVLPVTTGVSDLTLTLPALAAAHARHRDLPVVAVPLGEMAPAATGGSRVTTYRTSASALRALGQVTRYAAWLALDDPPPAPSTPQRVFAARRLVTTWLGGGAGRWIGAAEARELLAGYGIAVLGIGARSGAAAVRAVERVGLPVAVKVVDPGVVHKSEAGLVRTGLRTRAQVRDAYRDFAAALGHAPEVLVQPMVSGTELALGVVRDPTMGPLVMVATGGVATDVWDDRAFLLPPVSAAEARRAVSSLRAARLLDGFRGAPPGDVDGVVGLVTSLARLATEVPEVAELDLNPVVVSADGCFVVDVAVRVAPPVGPDGSAPRQLRAGSG
jgi:acyl-CoA synthetase (NDP forming)/GNAT superfamily N-acetyltransferase